MRIFLILFLIVPFCLTAQSYRKRQKVSNARGNLFGSFGYHRSWYTKSNLKIEGIGYDLSLKGMLGEDIPATMKFSNATIGQFNSQLGYYFRNHFAVVIGYDHMRYLAQNNSNVLLSGTVNPGIDTVTDLNGTYSNSAFITNTSTFNYENTSVNHFQLGITRSDQLIQLGQDSWFGLTSNVGFGLGGISTVNNFVFAGKSSTRAVSMSGFAISASLGLRFEFFKHFFFQSTLSSGMINQMNVHTGINEPNAIARQKYGYAQFSNSIGLIWLIRPTNDCNSCPNW